MATIPVDRPALALCYARLVESTPVASTATRKQRSVFLLVLGLITAFAFAIRAYRLADIPNGFHVDEASIGYDARCVLDRT